MVRERPGFFRGEMLCKEFGFSGPVDLLILARFANGKEAQYTGAVLELLKSDPFVVDIMDAKTGEVLYINEGGTIRKG